MMKKERKDYHRPGSYWRLVFHSNTPDMRHIDDYEYDLAAFNYLDLMRGRPYAGILPLPLRLTVHSGTGPLADHLANPMGLTVMSDRLLAYLEPMIRGCVELFPAPLYEPDGKPISGYQVVNVIKVLDCVDREATPSDIEHRTRTDLYIDPALAAGANMFKFVDPAGHVDYGVTCSYELLTSLKGKGFTGLAFIPYEMRDADMPNGR